MDNEDGELMMPEESLREKIACKLVHSMLVADESGSSVIKCEDFSSLQ